MYIVAILLYSPTKGPFDGAIPFLWLMAVSITACAAVWTVVVVGEEVNKKEKTEYIHSHVDCISRFLLNQSRYSLMCLTVGVCVCV